MLGMGLECGIEDCSPSCNSRSSIPISRRAATLMGGVFTSPCNQRNGFPFMLAAYTMSDVAYCQMTLAHDSYATANIPFPKNGFEA
jgi:hypothetical protein